MLCKWFVRETKDSVVKRLLLVPTHITIIRIDRLVLFLDQDLEHANNLLHFFLNVNVGERLLKNYNLHYSYNLGK